ncbi:hypothetical protein GCM10015535_32050 [Streptomyces gelaticus]|uniref:Uncharacterized protein n=1 Tax=Streptomyces gelaticus TaxID=285446 RepID=A0ABQ2VZM5_9ACTN|nr:hypothetical protein [Streptomyces gelaticus]GGV85447.1 hypothetical protein GCM10015535_32050 [Streptomyces gelaticus]
MRDAPRTTNDARRPAPWRTTARVTAVCGLVAVTWLALPAPAQALGSVRAPDSVRALDSAPALAAVRMQPSRALRADEVTKYYVVKSAQENGGEQETLFGIAQRTLGDGDRFEEILVLNSGRQLPDGSAFVSPDQLTPGFPLILPEDADGPGVEFGVLPEENADAAKPPARSASPSPRAAAGRGSGQFAGLGDRLGSPWLIGGVAGAAVLTVVIVARRPIGRAVRATGSGIARAARVLRPRLPRSLALALRRRRRGALARRLAADTRTPVMVRQALRELIPADAAEAERPVRVYSVLAEPTKLLASVSGAHTAPAPWTALEPNRWERTGLPSVIEGDPAADVTLALPHLARIGVSERGAQVMVDLGQINGALSVSGDLVVAQDTVAALVRGLLELPRQSTVVVSVDPGASALPGLNGLVRVRSVSEVKGKAPEEILNSAEELGVGLVRGAARTGEVTGFVVLQDAPTAEEARALADLTGSAGGGWIVLTVGDVPGAHWRWYAENDGSVDLGVLGLQVVVPTQTLAGAGTGRV